MNLLEVEFDLLCIVGSQIMFSAVCFSLAISGDRRVSKVFQRFFFLGRNKI